MRYAADHKDSTRSRLLETTATLVKKQGFAATGVDALMAAAGLTSGAFYSHFRNKNDLLEAIIESELKRSIALFSGKTLEQALIAIEGYLSPAHIAHPESGCAVPPLAAEIARASDSTQAVFERGIVELKKNIRTLVKDEATAWAIIAQMIGAVVVARALPSGKARDTLLTGVAEQVKQILEGAGGAPSNN